MTTLMAGPTERSIPFTSTTTIWARAARGTVETDLNSALLREPDGTFKPRAKSILAHTPSKRFASREGVAETLTALCVDQRHLTGNVLFADDGYVIEGHSWPEGNEALHLGFSALETLFERLKEDYPPEMP